MSEPTYLRDLPAAFGTLKPVGRVLVALPSHPQLSVLQTALRQDGFNGQAINEFRPHESVGELSRLIDNASGAAGFGFERVLMHRYLDLARAGHSWLLVRVDDAARAERVGQLGRLYGASSAAHYRTFTTEDLL